MQETLDPRVSVPWGMVKCADCGREYVCTPMDDHYLREGDPEGSGRVCTKCLLKTWPARPGQGDSGAK